MFSRMADEDGVERVEHLNNANRLCIRRRQCRRRNLAGGNRGGLNFPLRGDSPFLVSISLNQFAEHIYFVFEALWSGPAEGHPRRRPLRQHFTLRG